MALLKPHIIVIASALGAAVFVYWLSDEFRPDGVLGTLQVWLQFAIVIPYIVGSVIGGNPHIPNSLVFFVALFVQFWFLFAVIRWIVLRKAKRTCKA
jgi:hypothetical protein